MNNMGKNALIWLVIIIAFIGIFNIFQSDNGGAASREVSFSDFLTDVTQGHVHAVLIKGNSITGRLSDGTHFSTYAPHDPLLVQRLMDKGIQILAAPRDEETPSFLKLLLSWLPMLVFIGGWIFFLRQMQSGGNRAMGFGKSRARLMDDKRAQVTFADVAGVDEAKEELQEVVEFLKEPKKFQRLGGRIPKGVLLVGPPGTGKTLLARAIAGEANVPFFSISGSDFVEMFVGVGASRVRDMFEQGKKNAPCIIFIDEIDAVGRHRGAGLGGGNDEREQTLNQLLVEMDGFESNEGVILIAATNRPDVLDPALLRPGRFDRQVIVPNPDVLGREQILKVHMAKIPLGKDVDPKVIARGTPGFSGADLGNLVNEAALLAARLGKRVVGSKEFEQAKDKVMMGPERRTMVMTDEEKKLTAYHEAGHAVIALNMPDSDPIHKATIVPRGRALGMVVRLPEGDRVSMSRNRLLADLCVAMGGRIAEEIIFGPEKVTTGASSDIKMATDIAKRMVTEWGMSTKLGPLYYGSPNQEVFLGYSMGRQTPVSEATSKIIDEEVRSIVETSYERAKKILQDRLEDLHILAKGLLEYEILSADEIKDLLHGNPIVRNTSMESPFDGKGKTTIPSSGEESEEGTSPKPRTKKPKKLDPETQS